ncbi:MAG: cell envelope integrity protein TolA [Pseudomonadota bacterium]
MNARARGQWIDTSYGVAGTVVVHAAILLLVWTSWSLRKEANEPVQTTISARLVADETTVRQIAEPSPPTPVETPEPDRDAQRELDAELQRQAAEAREREAAAERERQAREREAELKRQQEAEAARERQAEVKRQQEAEAERQRQAEAERQRQAEAKRQQEAEAERQRQAELKRQQEAEAERQRQAELKRQQEAEAAARARQAELDAQLRDALEAEEARAGAINAGLLQQYIEVIRQKVERNWNRPAGVPDGIRCEVAVRQLRNGEVVSVRVTDCAGGEVLIRSIETAVRRASPLPPPKDASLFEANLRFPFRTGE